jgi:4-amino-4-deoxy-L-arabinose transferase-like glycosyltransferase
MNKKLEQTFLEKYKYGLIAGGVLLIYIFNLFIDVMDIDAAQYASISMEMLQEKNFLHVYHHGLDYLDKPPLLFWLSSGSMALFGINTFAYKLPSLLLTVLGLYSTYRFTCLYYSRKTGIYAALILATTQALFQITNDLRTDTNLLVFVIFSVWQLSLFVRNNGWTNLLLGFVGVAFAMMAKGPIGLVTVAIALGFDFLVRKEWKLIFNWKWLIGLAVVAILLIPLTWGLYTQFDLHPEKSAYGIDSPSGVRFFYWTQSFGRITGESQWDNGAGFFFFFHSILWDFQPWILYLILGTGAAIRSFFTKDADKKRKEYITLGGFLIVFLALSLSRFKLPHYVFVTFPFGAVLAADYLLKMKGKWALWYQGFFNLLFSVVAILGYTLIFPTGNVLGLTIVIVLIITSWYLFFKLKDLSSRIFMGTIVIILGFNFTLATHFYPNLLKFQAGSTVGKIVKEKGLANNEFNWYKVHDHSMDFYSGRITPDVVEEGLSELDPGVRVYTNKEGLNYINSNNLPFTIEKELLEFPVTRLNFQFLFENTRAATIDTNYLMIRK